MSVLVDTSFFVALKSLRDTNHARAVELLQGVISGEHGPAHTTDFVFTEAVTTALARTHRHSAAVGVGELFHARQEGVRLFTMDYVTPDQLDEAWAQFRRHTDRELSITDWTSVVVARDVDLGMILSFDHGFDGIYPRLA